MVEEKTETKEENVSFKEPTKTKFSGHGEQSSPVRSVSKKDEEKKVEAKKENISTKKVIDKNKTGEKKNAP